MRAWKTLIICCLTFSLLFSLNVSIGFAEGEQDTAAVQTKIEEPERLSEVIELRTKNSKTYKLTDESYEWVGYTEDIHYKDADGKLKEINNSIKDKPAKDGYTYSNTENSWYTYFADNLSKKNSIVLEKGDFSIAFSMVNTQINSKAAKSNTLDKSKSEFDKMLSEDNRAVIYKDVLKDVDVAYTVRTNVLKEDIILRAASAPNEFEFNVTTEGLSIQEKEGTVFFVDSKGKDVFSLIPMYMEDANGKYSDKVEYAIEENEGSFIITITADKEFLNAHDTQYPVIIDPSVMISNSSTKDTCVDEQYPTSYYYLSQNLWTGGAEDINRMRTFIRFNLPTNIAGINVTSSYLRIKRNAYSVPHIKAYRVIDPWESNQVNWNAQPSFTDYEVSPEAVYDSNEWYKLDVSTVVKKWMRGSYINYGLALREPLESDSNQKTRYYSSDAPSPNKPELHIFYTIPTAIYVSVRKVVDETYIEGHPDYQTKITNYINVMDDPFITTWNINFTHNSWATDYTLPPGDCTYLNSEECNVVCGRDGRCGLFCSGDEDDKNRLDNHHKNAFRNFYLSETGIGSAKLQWTFFDFVPCTGVWSAAGLTIQSLPYSALFMFQSDNTNMRVMQHEISHEFGCPDGECYIGQKCIMSGGYDYEPFTILDIWCTNCEDYHFDRDLYN